MGTKTTTDRTTGITGGATDMTTDMFPDTTGAGEGDTTTERFPDTIGDSGGGGVTGTDTIGTGEGGTSAKTNTGSIADIIGAGGGVGGTYTDSDTSTYSAAYTTGTGGVGGTGTTITIDSATDSTDSGGGGGGGGVDGPCTEIISDSASDTTDSSAGAGAGGGGSGGAIFAGPDVALIVSNTTFEGNSATDGGAVASYGGTLTNVTISNTATFRGGFGAVVSNDPGGEASPKGLDISGSNFEGNNGGAVAAFNTDVDIRDSYFTNNDGAVYFETSESERGYKLWVEGVRYEGNGPAPPSWGANVSADSGDLISQNIGDGQVVSCAKLLDVSCPDEIEFAMIVNDVAFSVTGDTDCWMCNEDGEVIEVNKEGQIIEVPSSSSDGVVGEGGRLTGNDTDNVTFIVAMGIVGIVACVCCAFCIVSAAKELRQLRRYEALQ